MDSGRVGSGYGKPCPSPVYGPLPFGAGFSMGDLIMPVAKRPGYYVEGRFFRDNYHQACARAKFQANEYGRRVEVTYLAPEDCGSVNNAVPYGVANFHPEVARPSKAHVLDSLPRDWPIVRAEWPSGEDIDVSGFPVPQS